MLMVVIVCQMLSKSDIWTIISLCYLNDVRTIWHVLYPSVEFNYSVVIIEQFMLSDHCCNNKGYQNYNFITRIRIVDYSHKMMQLFNVPWLMITLWCAIVQTQWLKRLSGSWAICIVCIRFYNAFDCLLMQHLLCKAVPVIATQTFLILGTIMILLLVQAYKVLE